MQVQKNNTAGFWLIALVYDFLLAHDSGSEESLPASQINSVPLLVEQ